MDQAELKSVIEDPKHYLLIEPGLDHPSGLEVNEVVWNLGYNVGTAAAYLLRAGKKPGNSREQDIRKAIKHLQMELEHV